MHKQEHLVAPTLMRGSAALYYTLFCMGVLAMTSCNDSAPQDNASPQRRPEELTPEAARRCLVEMIEREYAKHDVLGPELANLKSSPISRNEQGFVRVDRWGIDLTKKTWAVSFTNLERVLQYMGIFQRDSSGKWRAVLDGRVMD